MRRGPIGSNEPASGDAAADRRASEEGWVLGARAVVSIAVTAAVTALALGLRFRAFEPAYFWHNEIRESARVGVVGSMFAAALLAGGFGVVWLVFGGRSAVEALAKVAARVAPVAPLAGLSCFFDWKLWSGHPIAFLSLVLADSLALGATLSAALTVEPFERGRRLWPFEWRSVAALVARPRFPLGVAVALSFGYVGWFSYFTVVWHRSVRSGYDLAIEDSILWNLIRGRFFHAAPTLGPTGSHFGRHATLISYVLSPVYALHQSAETLLVIQSVLIGLAAIPLFLFARRRLGDWAAVLVAAAYLLHPAVQESNLFEVHYVKFGIVFLWAALWLLDSGRRWWALVAALLTLLVREDVATWVVLLGLFAFFSVRDIRSGFVMTAVGSLYVVVVKFVVMPMFREGHDDLLFMYQELLPKGHSSFGWVLVSALGNPGFTIESLLDTNKLVFLLEVLVPLSFLPLRRAVGWFALIPGILYCFLGTHYEPLVDIHYQYSPHLLAFLFPALVLVLEALPMFPVVGTRSLCRPAGLASLFAATLACSYQYGAVLQQHTSVGGPIPYKFGWDRAGEERHRAIEALLSLIPPNARVAGSACVEPQISSRPNGYSLSLGLYDAEWLVAPTVPSEYVSTELTRTRDALNGGFGVVAIEEPFFAARKGADSPLTGDVLHRLSRGH